VLQYKYMPDVLVFYSISLLVSWGKDLRVKDEAPFQCHGILGTRACA
jgi:hypothetical protein